MMSVSGLKFEWMNRVAWSEGDDSYCGGETYSYHHIADICPIEIIKVTENLYKHSFHVNRCFYPFIIGIAGATLRNLSTETQTKIFLPKIGDDDSIVIAGPTEEAVINARSRLDLLIETSRSQLKFTHFISIPGNMNEIQRNFIKFKENVLRTCNNGAGILREELFQKPEKLHLTLVMLVLIDEEDHWKAAENLQECKNNIITPTLEEAGPITINFRGVEIMNDDPCRAKVLYIRAHDESRRLQKIANRIADHFIEKGLSRRQHDSVKLHMTAMNTAFLRSEIKWRIFDATNILNAHANTYFGSLTFSSVHVSLRYSTGKDGFYQPISLITF